MSKLGTAMRYTKIGIKALFVLLIIFVYSLLFIRMCSVDDIPEEFSDLYIDSSLKEVYNSEGGDAKFLTQGKNKFNTDDDTYGYFSVASSLLVKESKHVQLVLKYNISTLEHLKDDYNLSVAIDRNRTDTFEYSLVIKLANSAIDYEADTDFYNKEENYTLVRVYPSKTEFLTAGRHNYVRCVFTDAEINSDRVLGVFLDVNYKDDIKYNQTDKDGKPLNSYASVGFYNYTTKDRAYKLTKADKEALLQN